MKMFAVIVLSMLTGALFMYAYMVYGPQESVPVVSTLEPTATTVQTAPTATSEVVGLTTGSLSGTLGYPSEGIPPLDVYAFVQSDLSSYYKISTVQNQQEFSFETLPEGTYVVVAYPKTSGELAGGYTPAVACGLSVDCTDHSLLPVVVIAGEETTGVAVKDWYAPEGTFPAKP